MIQNTPIMSVLVFTHVVIYMTVHKSCQCQYALLLISVAAVFLCASPVICGSAGAVIANVSLTVNIPSMN